MTLKHEDIVLMGPPGGGKGTQARILCDRLHIPHLSTGEMLREEARSGSELGLKIKELIDKGNFVPDEMSISLIADKLDSEETKNGFILDGFLRTVPQAQALDKLLKDKNLKLDIVIEIQVPDEYVIERIVGRYMCADCGTMYHDKFKKPKAYGRCDVCGGTNFVRRMDDNYETVVSRLRKYRAVTAPVLPYYEERGLLVCVDGTGSIETVAEKIKKVIGC